MYDTIELKLNAWQVCGVDFMAELPNYLTEVSEHSFCNGGVSVSGNLENLTFTITPVAITLKKGSFCKFLYGNNYKTPTRKDVQEGIEAISDNLHLPIGLARVTRIDVATNFIMKHTPTTYYPYLGVMKYASRLIQPNSLYYLKNGSSLCFYDKNKESKNHLENIPDLYKERSVLRYEHRVKSRLPQYYKEPEITASLLYDEAFYKKAVGCWGQAFGEVEKLYPKDILNYTAMKGKKDFFKAFASIGIECKGGKVAVLEQIATAQKKGLLSNKQALDLRQAVKEATQTGCLEAVDDTITELTEKVDNAIKFYR